MRSWRRNPRYALKRDTSRNRPLASSSRSFAAVDESITALQLPSLILAMWSTLLAMLIGRASCRERVFGYV